MLALNSSAALSFFLALWVGLSSPALSEVAPSAPAWYASGHRVTAAVAWEYLTPAVRDSVVRLLLTAPDDAGLASMMPSSGDAPGRALFIQASTWADVVKSRKDSLRRATYSHPTWHYVDRYWAQTSTGPLPLDAPSGETNDENAAERLQAFATTIGDPRVPDAERAVQIAWVIHLVGDVHQPLHASSRVTPETPNGDLGGNRFLLGDQGTYDNLHGYWDGILDVTQPRQEGTGEVDYAVRIARTLPPASRLDSTTLGSGPLDVETWLQESTDLAQLVVYLPVVQPGEAPSAQYERHALRTARERLRLGGLRLAAYLNHVFSA